MDLRDDQIYSAGDALIAMKRFLIEAPHWDGVILSPSQVEVILEDLTKQKFIKSTSEILDFKLNQYPVEIE